VTTEQPKRPYL